METSSRYQLLKDFLFYYGCILSGVYALQILGDLMGKKLPYSDSYQNPYGFFASILVLLIAQPYIERFGKRFGKKTIADYFPNADKE